MCYQPSVFFCPKKVPSLSTHELPLYGDSYSLIGQFGRDLPAKSLKGTEFERRPPLSLLTSASIGKHIVSSLKQLKDATGGITHQ